MKKNILIIVVAVVLIAGGVIAWRFFKGGNNSAIKEPAVVNPNVVNPNPNNGVPAGTPSFADSYRMMPQAQKDCVLNAMGQTLLDGFIKNDTAVMMTITSGAYERVSACENVK